MSRDVLDRLRVLSTGLCLLVLVWGCAPRGTITLDPSAAQTGSVHDILVVSTRAPVEGSSVLSRNRSDSLHAVDFSVSVPPDRLQGTVTFPQSHPPDPKTDFVTVSARRLNGIAGFQAAVDAQASRLPADNREALVFVHGFNVSFAEGLYRQAQISHDFKTTGVSVHYAWPSAADVRAYAVDRESALFARDGLEEVLTTLARSNVPRIVVVGHSMGAHLLMETIRQMEIRGAPGFFGKLASVVLIAPDLDIDVFRTQALSLAGHDVPIYLFVSRADRALRLSSLLRGRTERLGSITGSESLGNLPQMVPIHVIDITNFKANNDRLQHFKAVTSPSMIALLAGMGSAGLQMFREPENRPGLLESGGLAIQDLQMGLVSGTRVQTGRTPR
jgi:esterase/lipase superfamily enzyme